MTHFIVDECTKRVIGVVSCSDTSAPDIRRVIAEVKKNKPVGWSMKDIIKALPKDCDYVDMHDNSLIYV